MKLTPRLSFLMMAMSLAMCVAFCILTEGSWLSAFILLIPLSAFYANRITMVEIIEMLLCLTVIIALLFSVKSILIGIIIFWLIAGMIPAMYFLYGILKEVQERTSKNLDYLKVFFIFCVIFVAGVLSLWIFYEMKKGEMEKAES